MQHQITEIGPNLQRLQLDFTDEGVNLIGSINIAGDHAAAIRQMPVVERDLRTNFAELFPEPEADETEHDPEAM